MTRKNVVRVSDLKKMYTRNNRKWFGGQLLPVDEITIGFKKMKSRDNDALGWSRGDDKVFINQKLRFSNVLVEATLLHEMIHLKLPTTVNHGTRFRLEVRKLLLAGAFDKLI